MRCLLGFGHDGLPCPTVVERLTGSGLFLTHSPVDRRSGVSSALGEGGQSPEICLCRGYCSDLWTRWKSPYSDNVTPETDGSRGVPGALRDTDTKNRWLLQVKQGWSDKTRGVFPSKPTPTLPVGRVPVNVPPRTKSQVPRGPPECRGSTSTPVCGRNFIGVYLNGCLSQG